MAESLLLLVRNDSVLLAAGTATTIAISVFTQWYILVGVGVGSESDALYAAAAVPLFANAVLCDPLAFVLVPILSKRDPKRFWADSWSVISATAAVFGVVFLAIYFITPWILPIVLPGFESAGSSLVDRMSKVLILAMFLGAIGSSVRAVSHADDSYLWPTACSALGAACGLVWLVWTLPRAGIVAGAWATVVRMGVEMTLLFAGLRRFERPSFDVRLVQRIVASTWPLWFANLYYRSDILLDRALSSMAPAGGLSVLTLAQQVSGATSQILNRGPSARLLPLLSRQASDEDWNSFAETYTRYSRRLFVFLGICLAILMSGGLVVSVSAVQIGSMTSADLLQLWLIMVLLSGLLVGDPISFVFTSGFYALNDTRKPSQVSSLTFTLSIGLKIVGFLFAGLHGLALAISLFHVLRLWSLARALRRTLDLRLSALSTSH